MTAANIRRRAQYQIKSDTQYDAGLAARRKEYGMKTDQEIDESLRNRREAYGMKTDEEIDESLQIRREAYADNPGTDRARMRANYAKDPEQDRGKNLNK